MKTKTTRAPKTRNAVDDALPLITIRGAGWMKNAACHGVSTNIFFTELDEVPSADAQFLCRTCPVREQCLQHAITHDEDGYWGGTTKAQRDAIMSGRHRVKCPACASRDIIDMGNTICLSCGLSW